SLTLSGSTLYGMTQLGGSVASVGEVFQINTNGTGYSRLHSFAGGTLDGSLPRGSLLLSAFMLYGMTSGGGASNNGVIFALNVPIDLRIIAIERDTNDVRLTWLTAAGKTNFVQACNGNTNSGITTNFADISSPIVVPGSGAVTINYSDLGTVSNFNARYYR